MNLHDIKIFLSAIKPRLESVDKKNVILHVMR